MVQVAPGQVLALAVWWQVLELFAAVEWAGGALAALRPRPARRLAGRRPHPLPLCG